MADIHSQASIMFTIIFLGRLRPIQKEARIVIPTLYDKSCDIDLQGSFESAEGGTEVELEKGKLFLFLNIYI